MPKTTKDTDRDISGGQLSPVRSIEASNQAETKELRDKKEEPNFVIEKNQEITPHLSVDEDGGFISLSEASKLCAYGQDYLSLLARKDWLKSEKLGRNWFTKKEWLFEYLKQHPAGQEKADLGDLEEKKIEGGAAKDAGDKSEAISLRAAAEHCSYSQEYLSLIARKGWLKSEKIGRKWFTRKAWLLEYLLNHPSEDKNYNSDILRLREGTAGEQARSGLQSFGSAQDRWFRTGKLESNGLQQTGVEAGVERRKKEEKLLGYKLTAAGRAINFGVRIFEGGVKFFLVNPINFFLIKPVGFLVKAVFMILMKLFVWAIRGIWKTVRLAGWGIVQGLVLVINFFYNILTRPRDFTREGINRIKGLGREARLRTAVTAVLLAAIFISSGLNFAVPTLAGELEKKFDLIITGTTEGAKNVSLVLAGANGYLKEGLVKGVTAGEKGIKGIKGGMGKIFFRIEEIGEYGRGLGRTGDDRKTGERGEVAGVWETATDNYKNIFRQEYLGERREIGERGETREMRNEKAGIRARDRVFFSNSWLAKGIKGIKKIKEMEEVKRLGEIVGALFNGYSKLGTRLVDIGQEASGKAVDGWQATAKLFDRGEPEEKTEREKREAVLTRVIEKLKERGEIEVAGVMVVQGQKLEVGSETMASGLARVKEVIRRNLAENEGVGLVRREVGQWLKIGPEEMRRMTREVLDWSSKQLAKAKRSVLALRDYIVRRANWSFYPWEGVAWETPRSLDKPEPTVSAARDSEELLGRENIGGETGAIVAPLTEEETKEEMLARLKASFSDEVVIEPDKEKESGTIIPVHPATPEEKYLYVIVPVRE